ncbi:septum formation initiator domain-containing protein [Rutstroemia sp. NJR-2017a BBW]|nr:septum formation initiator domain-containing protein [Rutstroemia sp. NJR-2017a BBW]
MSSSNGDGSKLTSPVRPRHQVTRSISHRSQHHHHHHHYHHPHIHRRDKDEKSSQSTLQKAHAGSSIEGTKSEGVSPNESRNTSRRTSVFGSAGDGLDVARANIRRPLKDGELAAEKEKEVLMATLVVSCQSSCRANCANRELRNTLTDLNTLSNNTTRRLDNSYYAVLEKLSVLQSTIVSLKELASMTRELNEGFNTEAEEVVQEIKTQLDGFEGFEMQQNKVEGLEQRVKQGRETIKTLSGRVEVVRKRVESWEKTEQEWQEKTKKRLQILWVFISICATLLLAVVIADYIPGKPQGSGLIQGMNASQLPGVREIEKAKNESWGLTRPPSAEALDSLLGKDAKDKEEEKAKEDVRLQVFDEI